MMKLTIELWENLPKNADGLPLTIDEFEEIIKQFELEDEFYPMSSNNCPIAKALSWKLDGDASTCVGDDEVTISCWTTAREWANLIGCELGDKEPPFRYGPHNLRTYSTPAWARRIIHRVDRFKRSLDKDDVLRIIHEERAKMGG